MASKKDKRKEVLETAASDMLQWAHTFASYDEETLNIIGKRDLSDSDKRLAILLYYLTDKTSYKKIDIEEAEKDIDDFFLAMNNLLSSAKYKDLSFAKILIESIDTSKNKGGTLIAGSLLDNLFTETENTININNSKRSPRELAINKGAIISLDGALATFSSEDLQDAFNAFSLMELSDSINNYDFDKNGKLNTLETSDNDFIIANDIDTAALNAVLKAVIKTNSTLIDPTGTNTTVKLYLPSILKELHLDARGYSKNRTKKSYDDIDYSKLYYDTFAKKIIPFDKFIGRLPNGNLYRVLTIQSYDSESKTIVLDTPYMFKALELAMRKKEQDDKYIYLNELFKPEVTNERNHAAVELATRITNGLLQRGFTNPKKKKDGSIYFEYKIKYATLINECPQLSTAIKNCKSRQAINSKLKQSFNGAIKIIKDKTYTNDNFENLDIKEPFYPSQSTLNKCLIITYTGKTKK